MMRWSISLARICRCSSCPSSHAKRNWRPAIVALTCAMASLVRVEDRLNRADRRIQPFGDLAIGRLEAARPCSFAVEGCSEARAIYAQSVHLGGKTFLVPVRLLAPFDRSVERVERERQTLDRGIDCAFLRHRF